MKEKKRKVSVASIGLETSIFCILHTEFIYWEANAESNRYTIQLSWKRGVKANDVLFHLFTHIIFINRSQDEMQIFCINGTNVHNRWLQNNVDIKYWLTLSRDKRSRGSSLVRQKWRNSLRGLSKSIYFPRFTLAPMIWFSSTV